MPLPDFDSAVGHSFALDVDGVLISQLTEISGLRVGQDTIEVKSTTPDGGYVVRQLPGGSRPGELTLTRARDGGRGFEEWVADVRAAGAGGRDAAIVVFDAAGMPVRRYRLVRIDPKRLDVGTSAGGNTGVLTEKLVLTYEALEVE